MKSFCMFHDTIFARQDPCSVWPFKIVSILATVCTIVKKFSWWTFLILSSSLSDAGLYHCLYYDFQNVSMTFIVKFFFFCMIYCLSWVLKSSLEIRLFSIAFWYYSIFSCSAIFSDLGKFLKHFWWNFLWEYQFCFHQKVYKLCRVHLVVLCYKYFSFEAGITFIITFFIPPYKYSFCSNISLVVGTQWFL